MASEQKKAIMLMGPPGAGKSYMAQMIASQVGFQHVNTGELIKRIINNPKNADDEVIQREKEIYTSGRLNSEPWVASLIIAEAKRVFNEGKSVVFSGSPRTMPEAKALAPMLLRDYGKGCVYAFLLNIQKETALGRMKRRRVCSKCGISLMPDDAIEQCRLCGGAVISKSLDDPEKIKIRFEEYETRTKPILDYLKTLEILKEIDAEPSPEEIFKQIKKIIAK